MKSGLYNHYYKLGLEHFINKRLFGLHKTDIRTEVFYLGLILVIIILALIL